MLPRIAAGVMMTVMLAPGLTRGGQRAPRFTRKPTARKVGDRVKIEFALDRRTDVAVYVENARGEIVRHLVAGVLGKNAPEPLKANALSQSITWDLKDDIGKKAAGGPFKVRVAADTSVKFAGTVFSEQTGPNHISDVQGMTAGPDGRVYVLDTRGGACEVGGTKVIHVFLRDGSYEKTIKPFLSHLPPDRLKAARAFRDKEGRLIPIIHRNNGMTFYPYEDVPHHMAVTPEGHLLLAVVPSDARQSMPGATAHLALLDGEGGMPRDTYAGPVLREGYGFDFKAATLTVAADGKSAYLVGIGPKPRSLGGYTGTTCANSHAVYRVPLPARGPAKVFFGDPDKAGNDQEHLSNPRSIARDGRGHLLIADFGNNRVVVVNEKDGSHAASFDVETPSWVAVNPKKGAVYVCSGESIVKFSGWKDAKELARLKLPRYRRHRRFRWSFALDVSAEPPVLWVGRNETTWDRGVPLLSCEDRGGKFTELKRPGYYLSPFPRDLVADPLGQEISYCGRNVLHILNEESGKVRKVKMKGLSGTFVLGLGGRIYGMEHHHTQGVTQHDNSGKMVPFPATGGRLPETRGPGTKPPRPFVCVDRRGNIYAWSRSKGINVYGPDGKLKRTVIKQVLSRAVVGPRVDAQGNIYIAEAIRPAGKLAYPKEFMGRLGASKITNRGYTVLYGSIIKFGPKGGTLWCPFLGKGRPHQLRPFEEAKVDDPSLKVEDVIARNKPGGKLQGALWWRYGFSPQLDRAQIGSCHCLSTEFDVDDFGRVFYPDLARFKIAVLDTNGNPIMHFGGYGNQSYLGPDSYVMDAKGKFLRPRRPGDPKGLKSPFVEPEIAFAWIASVAVTDKYVYVADAINRRVLRIKMDYAAEETCRIR